MSYLHNIMEKIHNTTKDKILKLLLSKRKEEFTIRYISKRISIDYKAVHITVKRLIKSNVVKARKAGQTILCSINQKVFDVDMFRAESIRKREILSDKNIYVLYNRIKNTVKCFFILLLFGSYASGKKQKKSDIDLMLITNEDSIIKNVKHIVSTLPLKIHFISFNSEEFLSMLTTTKFNVGKEAADNNIILFGIEDYYRLIKNVG